MESGIGRQQPQGAPWTRRQTIALAAVLACGLVLGWLARAPDPLTGGDDLTHLLLSRSLGEGQYRNTFLVGAPPHVQYPPGMPAWLLLIRWTLGEGLNQVQGAQLVLLGVMALMIGDGLRWLGHAWLGVGATGAVVLNPMLQYYAGTMLSESMYTFWGVVTVWALLRAGPRNGLGWVTLAVAASLAGFLTRNVGLALIGTVGAWLLWRRRWRLLTLHAAMSLLVVVGWLWYTTTRGAEAIGPSYAKDLASSPIDGQVIRLLGRITTATFSYVRHAVPELLGLPMVPGTAIDNVVWTVILGVAGIGGLLTLLRRWEAVPVAFASTMAILLVWPWAIDRLAAPLIPLAIVSLLLGASAVGYRVGGVSGQRGAGLTMGAILLLSAAWRDSVAVARTAPCARGTMYAVESPCTTPAQRSLVQGALLAGRHLGASESVVSHTPAVVYHVSGRVAAPAGDMRAVPVEEIPAWLDRFGAGHILVTQYTPRQAGELLHACEILTVVDRAEPTALLLRLRHAEREERNACDALRSMLREQPASAP